MSRFLINQFIDVFDIVISKIFRLFFYHDDVKLSQNETQKFEKKIICNFIKNHEFFDKSNKSNVVIVVFIIFQT